VLLSLSGKNIQTRSNEGDKKSIQFKRLLRQTRFLPQKSFDVKPALVIFI
jgi:hypothetical protein